MNAVKEEVKSQVAQQNDGLEIKKNEDAIKRNNIKGNFPDETEISKENNDSSGLLCLPRYPLQSSLHNDFNGSTPAIRRLKA
jgi:hypothetical protein